MREEQNENNKKTDSRKKMYIQISLLLVLITLYICGAVMMNKPESPVNHNEKVSVPTANSLSAPKEEGSGDDEITSEPHDVLEDEPVKRYAAENERPDKTAPRDKYELPLPAVERNDEMKELTLPRTEAAEMTYFDGAVFIGDSVTLGLQNYVTRMRQTDKGFMGGAKFLSIGSYGAYEATRPADDKSIHRIIAGKKTMPADIVKSYNADKVFICLGLNDVGLFTKDEYLQYYKQLIDDIREQSPEIDIVIESITPMALYGERRVLYNAKIDEYNEALAKFAKDNSCYFADIANLFKDDAGYLASELCSDDYCHLNNDAYDIWINYLLNHTI